MIMNRYVVKNTPGLFVLKHNATNKRIRCSHAALNPHSGPLKEPFISRVCYRQPWARILTVSGAPILKWGLRTPAVRGVNALEGLRSHWLFRLPDSSISGGAGKQEVAASPRSQTAGPGSPSEDLSRLWGTPTPPLPPPPPPPPPLCPAWRKEKRSSSRESSSRASERATAGDMGSPWNGGGGGERRAGGRWEGGEDSGAARGRRSG